MVCASGTIFIINNNNNNNKQFVSEIHNTKKANKQNKGYAENVQCCTYIGPHIINVVGLNHAK